MTEAGGIESRLEDMFAAIDAKDSDGFVAYLTDDAIFRFGSAPAVTGRVAIRDAVDGFFESIAGSKHELGMTMREGDTLVCEGNVTYRRRDGTDLTLPFTDVFELRRERIAEYKIYIDIGPLFAN